jgi:hypothetical protein
LGSTLSDKHVAKHRSLPVSTPLRTRLRRRLRVAALGVSLAVGATGLAVSTGVFSQPLPIDGSAAALSASTPAKNLSKAELAEREQRVSRSSDDRRPVTARAKARTLSNASGKAVTRTEDLSDADPRDLTKALMPQFGMSSSEFGCVDNIWSQESGWNVHAANPTSSAYGIPQALPGSKMASAGPNWESNAETQIKWGLGYIRDRYGSPCAAWGFKSSHGWY